MDMQPLELIDNDVCYLQFLHIGSDNNYFISFMNDIKICIPF